ncbi:hypothetical protein [Treponema sp. R80B11-R83G3]
MKKKGLIIASLLVLVMSFVFLGCPPPEDTEEVKYAPVDAAAMTALRDTIGYTDSLFPSPDCDYYGYKLSTSGEELVISWKDGDAEKFDAYKEKWGNKVASNVSAARAYGEVQGKGCRLNLTDKDGEAFYQVSLSLVATAGTETETGMTVNAGDILFIIYK